ncbi:tyrosine-type recombinase/integrase [Vibrio splendidus]|uniref:tyrosine-type recombinase/integrase n=1 Tax=Vibrio splendidus TaxID=29497 RepID=UPI00352F8A8D
MHLVSRNNTYYFQRRIPKEIQSRYNGKQHLKFSLQTKDKRQALILARKLSAQFDIEFETIQCVNLPDFSNKFNTATSLQESTRLNLSSCVSDFIETKRVDGISKKALERYQARLNLLVDIVKDRPIDSLKRSDALEFKSILVKLPPNLSRNPEYKSKSFVEIIKLGHKPIGTHTINDTFKVVSGFFDWCVLNEKAQKNSFTKLGVKQETKASEQRLAFTKSDLKKVFSADVFQNEPKEAWHKWIPLLGLYTGARLNELCQLYCSDIRLVDGVWCIHFGTDYEDQKLKTQSAYRTIPIHSNLIKKGFIDYVHQQSGRLFPTLKYLKTDGYSKYPSKWFSVQRDKALTPKERERKTFHSIRHTVATEFKRSGVDYHIAAAILGHHNDSMTYGRYGKEYSLVQLAKAIEILDFDTLL